MFLSASSIVPAVCLVGFGSPMNFWLVKTRAFGRPVVLTNILLMRRKLELTFRAGTSFSCIVGTDSLSGMDMSFIVQCPA